MTYTIVKRHRLSVTAIILLLALVSCGSGRTEAVDSTSGYLGPVEDLDLEALKGRVVVLNFWATWCSPCRIEIPDLVQLRKDFADKDLAIIGVSVDNRGSPEELETLLQHFVQRYEINYPVYLDADWKFSSRYDPAADYLQSVPTTVIIDQNGAIHDTHVGIPRDARGNVDPHGVLSRQVQALLDGA